MMNEDFFFVSPSGFSQSTEKKTFLYFHFMFLIVFISEEKDLSAHCFPLIS